MGRDPQCIHGVLAPERRHSTAFQSSPSSVGVTPRCRTPRVSRGPNRGRSEEKRSPAGCNSHTTGAAGCIAKPRGSR